MARYTGMADAIFPAIYNPGVVMNTVNLLGVYVNVGQRSGRWNVLWLLFLLVLIFAGYVFAIRKIQNKRDKAVREQSDRDESQ